MNHGSLPAQVGEIYRSVELLVETKKQIITMENYNKLFNNPSLYNKKLEHLKKMVYELVIDSFEHFPQIFSDRHFLEHCRNIANTLEIILGKVEEISFTDDELFFLITSSWLHDIGLLRGILKGDRDQITPDIILMHNHQYRAEQFLVNNPHKFNLSDEETSVIALLIRHQYLTNNLDHCPHSFPYNNNLIRLKFLAAILKLSILFSLPSNCSGIDLDLVKLELNNTNDELIRFFVIGVEFVPLEKDVVIHLLIPSQEQINNINENESILETIKVFHRTILEYFKLNFEPIKNILIKEKCYSFIDVSTKIHRLVVDDVRLNRIIEIAKYGTFNIFLDINKTATAFIACTNAINNIYQHSCYLSKTDPNTFPLVINSLRFGSLFLEVFGGGKAIALLKDIVGKVFPSIEKRFTKSGQIATINEIADTVLKIIQTKNKLQEIGIDTPELDTVLKEVSLTISKELHYLATNTCTVKVDNTKYLISCNENIKTNKTLNLAARTSVALTRKEW